MTRCINICLPALITRDQARFTPTPQAPGNIKHNHNIIYAAKRQKLNMLFLELDIKKPLIHCFTLLIYIARGTRLPIITSLVRHGYGPLAAATQAYMDIQATVRSLKQTYLPMINFSLITMPLISLSYLMSLLYKLKVVTGLKVDKLKAMFLNTPPLEQDHILSQFNFQK